LCNLRKGAPSRPHLHLLFQALIKCIQTKSNPTEIESGLVTTFRNKAHLEHKSWSTPDDFMDWLIPFMTEKRRDSSATAIATGTVHLLTNLTEPKLQAATGGGGQGAALAPEAHNAEPKKVSRTHSPQNPYHHNLTYVMKARQGMATGTCQGCGCVGGHAPKENPLDTTRGGENCPMRLHPDWNPVPGVPWGQSKAMLRIEAKKIKQITQSGIILPNLMHCLSKFYRAEVDANGTHIELPKTFQLVYSDGTRVTVSDHVG